MIWINYRLYKEESDMGNSQSKEFAIGSKLTSIYQRVLHEKIRKNMQD
jgi:hypothetical protein